MQGAQNQFSLDFKDNPDLKAAFANKKAGDKFTFTVTAQIDNMDDERVEGTIEEIQPKGFENPNAEAGEPKDTVTPDNESPVMLVMQMGKGKSGQKAGSKSSPSDEEQE